MKKTDSRMRIFIFVLLSTLIWSCKNQCPLPSCQIRTQHHHALNFTNTKEHQKQLEKEQKEAQKAQQELELQKQDSIATAKAQQEMHDNLSADNDTEITTEEKQPEQ